MTTSTGYSPAALQDRLPDWIDLPAWMLTDSEPAAALWILTAMYADQRIWTHVQPNWIDFDAILAEPGWSATERATLSAAWSIAGADCEAPARVSLADLACRLDQERFDAVLEALRLRRAAASGW
jgi:hypothetical protein